MNHTEQLADLTARLKQAEAERDAARAKVKQLKADNDESERIIIAQHSLMKNAEERGVEKERAAQIHIPLTGGATGRISEDAPPEIEGALNEMTKCAISEFDRLEAQKNDMLVRQGRRWTKQPPERRGWYWMEDERQVRHCVFVSGAKAIDGHLTFEARFGIYSVANSRFRRWAGPIQEPRG